MPLADLLTRSATADTDLILRAATIDAPSFNEANRTVRVTFSTGAAVPRRDAQDPYSEVLSLADGHVDLSRMEGAPVLDSHRSHALEHVLGAVTRAGIENGHGWADIRFSGRAEVAPFMQDVRDGVIRHVSVGYSVARWQDSKDPATGGRVRTATSWQPREISFVPVPADPGARVRSADGDAGNRAEVNASIRSIATVSGLDAAWADRQIDAAATIEQARSAAFEELVRRGGGAIRTQRVEVGQSNDDPAVQLGRMTEALVARINPSIAPSDAARPYMNLGLVDMARQCLAMRGERVGMVSREELLSRAAMHTLSDFPNLLTGVGNRVLQAAYSAAPNPLKALARQTTLNDFRPKTVLKLSDMPKLSPVSEAGEIKSVSRSESRETYSLGTFGQIFTLSRKAIINDDLGAFSDWSVAMGRAAAETEADQLVQLLLQNGGAGPTMGDGKALFHAAHGNLAAAGSAVNIVALTGARQAMRLQKGLDGVTPINATPRFILVAPDEETAAQQAVTTIYPATADASNPFSGQLSVLVEPRLPLAGAWFVFADPAVLPVLEYAYLTSAPGPQVASRPGWDTLGQEFRVVLDFGAGAIDWRGAYRTPAAA